MLEGPEVSVVKYSATLENKDFRIDSSFYIKAPKKNLNIEYRKIGDCLISSQYGISIEMNEEGKGYPIYRMNEIHNMLCDLDVNKCAEISDIEFHRFELKDRDVLFNRTNSFEWVGRTGIYYQKDDAKRTFASYLVRFNPNENIILPEYLCAYLNTKQGVWDIKRRARQSINQTNVNPEEVKEIEIPLLDMNIQKQIQSDFQTAHSYLSRSKTLYAEAESLLLRELGLNDWQPKNESVSIKRFSDFTESGRLDAEYYQPKYDEIEKKFSKFERIKLSDLVTYPISSGITPKAGGDDYTTNTEKGIPFIRAVDLNNGQVCIDNFLYIKPNIHSGILKRTQLCKNDVLFSIAGTVGRTAIFEYDFAANINQAVAILRFPEHEVMRLYLICFFNSYIGKIFIEKYARQGLQTNLNLTELSDISIPKLPMPIQHQISEKIQESFRLRAESRRLLEEAKEKVELSIKEVEFPIPNP